jgi:hypothetical protein
MKHILIALFLAVPAFAQQSITIPAQTIVTGRR